MKEYPLVSVIVRTCGRPEMLKRAMDSIVNQDYKNIEIVVVEDGTNISEEILNKMYGTVSYQYFNTKTKGGRSAAGNIGLRKAKGVYLNFLDDDDIFLPNHVSTLVEAAINFDKLAVYSIAEEYQIINKDFNQIKRKLIRYQQPYIKLLLCSMNYIPIQSILFHRTLFEKYGGFDEGLDFLEDWDMWVRYSAICDFKLIHKVTSIYYTPFKSKEKKIRDIKMKKAEEMLRNKFETYHMNLSAEQIRNDMDYILNVFNKKGIIFYMKKIRDFLLYWDI